MDFHWKEYNPWADQAIYIEPAELHNLLPEEKADRIIREYGPLLDVYLLPKDDGGVECGIRFGAKPNEYLTPPVDPETINGVLRRTIPDKTFSRAVSFLFSLEESLHKQKKAELKGDPVAEGVFELLFLAEIVNRTCPNTFKKGSSPLKCATDSSSRCAYCAYVNRTIRKLQ